MTENNENNDMFEDSERISKQNSKSDTDFKEQVSNNQSSGENNNSYEPNRMHKKIERPVTEIRKELRSAAGFANASMWSGIVGTLLGSLLFSIVGIVFSRIATKRLNRENNLCLLEEEYFQRQIKKARIGLIISIIGVVVSLIMFAIIYGYLGGDLNIETLGSSTGSVVTNTSSTWG